MSSSFSIKFTTNLDGTVNDEAWGFSELEVRIQPQALFGVVAEDDPGSDSSAWSTDSILQTDAGVVRGPFALAESGRRSGSSSNEVEGTYDVMDRHTSLQLTLRIWAVGTWNTDNQISLAVDNVIWWSDSRPTGSCNGAGGWYAYTGDFNISTACSDCVCFQDVSVSCQHYSSFVSVRVWASVAGTSSDVSWAFDQFTLQSDGTPLQPHALESDPALQTTESITLILTDENSFSNFTYWGTPASAYEVRIRARGTATWTLYNLTSSVNSANTSSNATAGLPDAWNVTITGLQQDTEYEFQANLALPLTNL